MSVDIGDMRKRQILTFKPKESDLEPRGKSLTVEMAGRSPSDSIYSIIILTYFISLLQKS